MRDWYEFSLEGPFKPYVRMTRRGKWVDPQAQEYLASKEALQWQFREQMGEAPMIPRGVSLNVYITMTPVSHRGDIDNFAKAFLDAAQGIVFEDDRWVDALYISRGGHSDPLVKMVVEFPMQGKIVIDKRLTE